METISAPKPIFPRFRIPDYKTLWLIAMWVNLSVLCLATDLNTHTLHTDFSTYTVNDYVQHALSHNSGLLALQEMLNATKQKERTSAYLPSPMVSYSEFSADMEEDYEIMVQQTFPWFGTLHLKKMIESLNSQMISAQIEWMRQKIARDVKVIFFNYLLLKESIHRVQSNLTLMHNLEPIVQKKIQNGGNQNDLLRIQIEIVKIQNQLKTLEAKRSVLSQQLKSLLGNQDSTDIPWPKTISPVIHALPKELEENIFSRNRELHILQLQIAQAEKYILLSKKETYPELGMEISKTSMKNTMNSNTADTGYMFTVQAMIPLWFQKNKASVKEAKHRLLSLQNSLKDKHNSLMASYALIRFELEDSARQISLYQDELLPRTKQTLNLTERSYQAGSASIFEVIDSQRTLIEFELLFWQAVSLHEHSLAELLFIQGDM